MIWDLSKHTLKLRKFVKICLYPPFPSFQWGNGSFYNNFNITRGLLLVVTSSFASFGRSGREIHDSEASSFSACLSLSAILQQKQCALYRSFPQDPLFPSSQLASLIRGLPLDERKLPLTHWLLIAGNNDRAGTNSQNFCASSSITQTWSHSHHGKRLDSKFPSKY